MVFLLLLFLQFCCVAKIIETTEFNVEVEEIERYHKVNSVYSDNIPNYLSYGHYTQKRITESELRERVDPRIKRNCKFCEYPLNDRNFRNVLDGSYRISDAFTGGYGEDIILIVDCPIKTREKDFKNSILEVYTITIDSDNVVLRDSVSKELLTSPIFIPVKSIHSFQQLLILTFSISNIEGILNSCFQILMKNGETGHNYLASPILVRHCHGILQPEKPDKLSLCAMVYNKDRFLIEWIEWHRMMGVSHFYIYAHQGKSDHYDTTFSLLETYIKDEIVSLFIWNCTRDEKYWTRDQVAALNDCLWRFRDKTKYILLLDDDEFIVPLSEEEEKNKNLISIIDQQQQQEKEKELSGFLITSIFFNRQRLNTTSSLTTNTYFQFNRKEEWRKLVIISDNVLITSIHNIRKSKLKYGRTKTKILEGVFIAHYHERKFHEYNEIVDDPDNLTDENNFWFYKVQKFSEEMNLEKRVSQMEKKLKVSQYQFNYHNFIDNIDDLDENDYKEIQWLGRSGGKFARKVKRIREKR